MKKFYLPILFIALIAGTFLMRSGESPEKGDFEAAWFYNLEEAKAFAQKEGRLVFLEFLGSDWCPPCKQMEAEVYTQKAFVDYSDKVLSLVKVDFPRYHDLSEAQKAYNEALAQRFKIQAFPTVVVLDSEGKELNRWVGVIHGGPEGLIASLEKIKKSATL